MKNTFPRALLPMAFIVTTCDMGSLPIDNATIAGEWKLGRLNVSTGDIVPIAGSFVLRTESVGQFLAENVPPGVLNNKTDHEVEVRGKWVLKNADTIVFDTLSEAGHGIYGSQVEFKKFWVCIRTGEEGFTYFYKPVENK